MPGYPHVGYVFENLESFLELISALAEKEGFSVLCRRWSTRDDKTTPKHKEYVCHRFGPSRAINSMKRDCTWRLRIAFNRSIRPWKVTRIDTRHVGHEMLTDADMATTTKYIPPDIHELILRFYREGVPASSMTAMIKCVHPSLECTWSSRAIQNFINMTTKGLLTGPQAMQLKDLLDTRKQSDTELRYEMLLGDNATFRSVFWMTGRQRALCQKFGDVMVFDSTYQTNDLALPLACFVGITGNGLNVLLACAIISDETTVT